MVVQEFYKLNLRTACKKYENLRTEESLIKFINEVSVFKNILLIVIFFICRNLFFWIYYIFLLFLLLAIILFIRSVYINETSTIIKKNYVMEL